MELKLEIGNAIQELSPWTVEVRRYLHQHPELSREEKETAKYIKRHLEEMGIEVMSYGETDVIGLLKGTATRGDKQTKTVALRADIDALPVTEETGLRFASKNKGIMHACGHDGHTSILLTVAKVLSERKHLIKGNIKFIFQHAEEVVPGGAEGLVKAGVLDDVDAIFGLHLWQPVKSGIIAVKPGPIMAGADEFLIRIKGKGGHGSMPHDTVDPVVVASSLIMNLQTLVSRSINPLYPVVVSVGTLQAGTTYNVIPDTAYLRGTIRYFHHEVQDSMPGLIRRLSEGICSAFGAACEVEYTYGDPPVINDEEMNHLVQQAASFVVGEENVIEATPSMGGEDFAYYLQKKPGCFFFVGIQNDQNVYPHHHPKFDIDEEMLPVGAAVMTTIALSYLK
ncbi:amidohydrolase [Microaerobacter geothermalis]|uniref:M20 metallopeptidase family protein n=1 Tax=Microaerobacter geothermalis TaxID=674972 RepID=UPI001F42AFAB|nr:amidohydrolase [Microaerobacter geothermalis]MCF6094943.1 amidohydrolase [Microaerobacter geothermalis]